MESAPEFDQESASAWYHWSRILGSDGSWAKIGGDADYYESGFLVLNIGLWDPASFASIWNATTDSYEIDQTGPEGVRKFGDFVFATLTERGFI